MSDAAAAPPADVLDPTGFSSLLLNLSVSGVMLMRPRYEADGEIVDFDGVWLNPAAQQMLRLPECPAESFRTLYPTAQAAGVFDFYREAFLSDTVARRQNLYQRDGLDGYYALVAQRYQDLLVVSFTDTNDQPRSAVEDALRASQAREQAARAMAEAQRQRFYDLLMQLPANVAVNEGPDQVFTLVNPGYQRQAPGLHLLGQPIRQVWPELVDHGILDELSRVYRTGEPFTATELPVQVDLTRTGQLEQGYYTFFFLPLRDAQGQLNGVLNFSYNVTDSVVARQQVEQLNAELEARVQERTQVAEQALVGAERERARLQALIAQAPVAIALFEDEDLRFASVNPAMAAFWGSTPAQVLNQPLLEALPELRGQGFDDLLRQVLRTQVPLVTTEVPVSLQREGKLALTYYNSVYQPLYAADRQVLGVLAVAVEVTDQVQARQQVQELNEELAAINEELTATNEELNESNTQLTRTNIDLDTFVYTASHDLKAPISNIESITLALRDTLPADVQQDEMIAHLLELLEHTTTRFQRTIGQLTDLSKLQLAHAGPAEPVPLAATIEAVRLDLAPTIVEANAQLTVEVASDLRVSFSPANLRSAIYNLLSNAVKYRALDRPAQVQVRAFPAGGRVTLEVQDNGLGLNAHQQSRLFGLFQRLHTHVEGTGVGLYITKRLVENGGGTIAVESQAAVGTTFTLTFPA